MENFLFFFFQLIALFYFLRVSSAQSTAGESYCNRIYHSIALINHTLYVDGGELRTV